MRSKVLGALPNLAYLKQQIELYRLANGTYPPDNLNTVMDLAIPGCSGGGGERYRCKEYGFDYEGWNNPLYIRCCFPSCSEGVTKTVTLHWFMETNEKRCASSQTGFCNSIKGVWKY